MASKRLSPSAQLLRRSRLFSLPPNLAHPPEEQKGVMKNFDSDTAMLRYPTHATIETPPSSLARGDWGLKRPLPLKSTTNTSTPLVRVKEIDSIDHITDYESAADHTLTLRKWQEMNIPLISAKTLTAYFKEYTRKTNQPHNVFDVFEENPRSTAELEQSMREENPQGSATSEEPYPKRWKFKGPWLGGMNSVEFERFVGKQVKARRAEFRQYLRDWILKERREKAQDKARDAGKDFDKESITLSSNEFHTEIVRLRQERRTLSQIIWTFLDLPGALGKEKGDHDLGPPVTHPSAGLSYLRSDSHVYNHPLLGPQASGPPVRSRVLRRPSNSSRGLIGMGGVVAQSPVGIRWKQENHSPFNKHGGERGWYQPDVATIDSRGRIDIRTKPASDDAIAVWEKEFHRSTNEQKREKEDINNGMEDNIGFDSMSKIRGGNILPAQNLIKQSPRAARQ